MKTNSLPFSDLNKSMRFDSSFHLSEGTFFLKKLRSMPYSELQDLTLGIFTAGRSKRMYTQKEFGYPYLSNSDIVRQSPVEFCKYNSKKYGYDKQSFLKEGMIVTGRVGSIGQTAFITSEFEKFNAMGSDNIIRIVPNKYQKPGYLYAFLASKYGNTLFWKLAAGGLQPYISDVMIKDMPIPELSKEFQCSVDKLVKDSAELRVNANELLREVQSTIKSEANLKELNPEDYEYFGNHSYGRDISTQIISVNKLSSQTINAFNYSTKIDLIRSEIKKQKFETLGNCIENNNFFSTGSFRRLEIDSEKSIKLINQSDILHFKKKGKLLARRYINIEKLVEYGEILIAGVGTLGENETFCRTIFANEELEGELISGEFIRMKSNSKIPSGYLFSWLASDYGFRLIRSTQSGTKLCRPIQELLKEIPVPILDEKTMQEIDKKVKKAHTMMFQSLQKDNEAIKLVEKEIEEWQK